MSDQAYLAITDEALRTSYTSSGALLCGSSSPTSHATCRWVFSCLLSCPPRQRISHFPRLKLFPSPAQTREGRAKVFWALFSLHFAKLLQGKCIIFLASYCSAGTVNLHFAMSQLKASAFLLLSAPISEAENLLHLSHSGTICP